MNDSSQSKSSLIFIAIAAIVFFFFVMKKKPEPIPTLTSPSPSLAAPETPNSSQAISPTAVKSPAVPVAPGAPTAIPSREEMQSRTKNLERLQPPTKTQIENDPAVIDRFGEHIGDRMAEALVNSAKISALFSELENCVRTESDPAQASARGYCLINARLLAQKDPQFKNRYSALEKIAGQEATSRFGR